MQPTSTEPTRTAASRGPSRKQKQKARKSGPQAAAVREGAVGEASSLPLAQPPKSRSIGVLRPSYGKTGSPVPIAINAFSLNVQTRVYHQYEVSITPAGPRSLMFKVFKELQVLHQDMFNHVVHDGKKFLFAPNELPLENDSAEFDVRLVDEYTDGTEASARYKSYKLKITKLRAIDLSFMHQHCQGSYPYDEQVATGNMGLNILVKMEAISQNRPFNARSFFTDVGKQSIGNGLELWRGYVLSVRMATGKILLNVDISTGLMFQPGPLIDVCLLCLGADNVTALEHPKRGALNRLIGAQVTLTHKKKVRTIKGFTSKSANEQTFLISKGKTMTVEDYYKEANLSLSYPNIICVELGTNVYVPLEFCTVMSGTLAKDQFPEDKIAEITRFASLRPQARFKEIKKGLEMMSYEQSDYLRAFGVDIEAGGQNFLNTSARRIDPPALIYGGSQTIRNIKDGSWNMKDKTFFRPANVVHWLIMNYDPRTKWAVLERLRDGLVEACTNAGMGINQQDALIIPLLNGQGNIFKQLQDAGSQYVQRYHGQPDIIIIVVLDHGNDIYNKIKHYGDVLAGVPTQCVKGSRVFKANRQYWANVAMKINVKLGGINAIPDSRGVERLDPNLPTIVLGADVIDPPPGVHDQPSFTALVSSLDSNLVKYTAITRVQPTRTQIIEDMYLMTKNALTKYMDYRRDTEKENDIKPKRIIFYRDGVSEAEYIQVRDNELPQLYRACLDLKIEAKITLIVVGKRHHYRFKPEKKDDKDRSGNCPAGTVVDTDITHPADFDFYLQSHGGILGTSRPAHYYVIHDDNGFDADSLQSFSYAMCHIHARATRSVSIPAPVYYADIVCARAKHHYAPGSKTLSEPSMKGKGKGKADMGVFEKEFLPLAKAQEGRMYFM